MASQVQEEHQPIGLGTLECLPQYVLMHALSYLSAVDSSRIMRTCRRLCLLLLELSEALAPEIAVSTLQELGENETRNIVKELFGQIHARPSLVIIFQMDNEASASDLPKLPPGVVTVVANCSDVVSLNQNVNDRSSVRATKMSSFVASLSEKVLVEPFKVEASYETEMKKQVSKLRNKIPEYEDREVFWKAFIIIGTESPEGFEAVHYTIQVLRKEFPQATITGGIARDADVISPSGSYTVTEGAFCVAMGGNVPMRGCVTRGVESLSEIRGSIQVAESEYHSHPDYPTNLVKRFSHDFAEWTQSCISSSGNSGFRNPHFIGIRRQGENGYMLHSLNRSTFMGSTAAFPAEPGDADDSLVGSELKLFRLTQKAIVSDLDDMLCRLKAETESNQEELMGALVFTCNGRGPSESVFIKEENLDASRFAEKFPNLPLMGFYCAGEIGPAARALVESSAFQSGLVSFQGFTAVFGIFVRPKLSPKPHTRYNDVARSEERLEAYLKSIRANV